MKNLMVYMNGKGFGYKKFDNKIDCLIKAQIDNSLRLGWNKKDIILITNFNYTYNSITAYMTPDLCVYSGKCNPLIGIYVALREFNDTVWYHHHDAFQLRKFDIDIDSDIHIFKNHNDTLNPSSIFVKKNAIDIIEQTIKTADYRFDRFGAVDDASVPLTKTLELSMVSNRVKYLDPTMCYESTTVVDSPNDIKVVHFNPYDETQWKLMCTESNIYDRRIVDGELRDAIKKCVTGIEWYDPKSSVIGAHFKNHFERLRVQSFALPYKRYDQRLDRIEVFNEDAEFKEKWIDNNLTIYIAIEDGRTIGYALTGAGGLIKSLGADLSTFGVQNQ